MPRSYLVAASALAGLALVIGASIAVWSPPATDDDIQASCPQPRATVIPEEWREQDGEEGTAFHDAVLSAAARKAILQPSRFTPAPSFTSASPERQIESLQAGRVIVQSTTPAQNVGAIAWGVSSEGSYYSTQLHGFAGIGNALSASDKLPQEVERTISSFIKDWAVCNIPKPGLHDRAWSEGAVVKRLSNLLIALNYMKRHGAIAGLSYDQLIYLIDENKDHLVDTEQVYEYGNHGVRQDLVLAATAIAIPELPDSDKLIHLAEERLREASEQQFTRDGIWAEHAPGYAQYAVRLMLDVRNLANADPRFYPHAFLSHLTTSLDYLLASLTPGPRDPVDR